MPLARPPTVAKTPAACVVLTAGTRLWRVHPRTWSGAEFNDVRSDPYFGGNRFDSTPDDPFHYLYAAVDPQTAVLETLVRGIPFDDKGKRMIRRSAVRDMRITAIELSQELKLISLLTTADLARVCQDEWLTSTHPAEYPQTRRWCQWLRSRSGWAQGMIWRSARSLDSQSLVLFGDRTPDPAVRVIQGSTIELDSADGAAWLNRLMQPYLISVRPPARSRHRNLAASPSRARENLALCASPAAPSGRRLSAPMNAARRRRCRRRLCFMLCLALGEMPVQPEYPGLHQGQLQTSGRICGRNLPEKRKTQSGIAEDNCGKMQSCERS
jgi:hypothetical protein